MAHMRTGPSLAWLAVLLACYCCGRTADAGESRRARVRAALELERPSVFDRESTEERTTRLDSVADAIALASRTDQEAAALLTIGHYESRWARYVGDGCDYPDGIPEGAGHCDRGTSRSYWQMKRSACPAGWAERPGSDEALREFATCARRLFNTALRHCQGRHPAGNVAGAMAGYRLLTDCTWPEGATRARTFWATLSRLQTREGS